MVKTTAAIMANYVRPDATRNMMVLLAKSLTVYVYLSIACITMKSLLTDVVLNLDDAPVP
jgi:hypothetical protein